MDITLENWEAHIIKQLQTLIQAAEENGHRFLPSTATELLYPTELSQKIINQFKQLLIQQKQETEELLMTAFLDSVSTAKKAFVDLCANTPKTSHTHNGEFFFNQLISLYEKANLNLLNTK